MEGVIGWSEVRSHSLLQPLPLPSLSLSFSLIHQLTLSKRSIRVSERKGVTQRIYYHLMTIYGTKDYDNDTCDYWLETG